MGKFSKTIIGLIIAANIVFTIAVLVIFVHVGSEPSTLIAAWFAFTTGELWMLAGIKKAKLKKDSEFREDNELKKGGQDYES